MTDFLQRPRCDHTVAWGSLKQLYAERFTRFDLNEAFAADPARAATFSLQAPHVFADFSKTALDTDCRVLLLALAEQCQVAVHCDAMFSGQPINVTEQRAALHTALRAPKGAAPFSDEVHAELDALMAYAEAVRGDEQITDIVNIGIGGSDLGPQMAAAALDPWLAPHLRLHFVSNVDGHDLQATLRRLKPHSTLFLIASKTFTTQETLLNATSARAWFIANGGSDIARHFVGLTTNLKAAAAFGISRSFGFHDWVGGRYSLWSAIGLSLAIGIGATGFRQMLAGAHAMDEHFLHAPAEQNLPLHLGLLDVWQRNFMGYTSRSVAPYHHGLRRLPAYLQQLEMESNGKRVDMHGNALPYGTSAVIWGESGTNGQHAYFQMLHQGTTVVPVEFIVARYASHGFAAHQPVLLANVVAQAQALMQGRSAAEVLASAGDGNEALTQARSFPGNRPSSVLMLDELTPESLGALIALYEHRVFVAGSVWGINSFDQWGVELGKQLAKQIELRLATGDVEGLDSSSAALVEKCRA